MYCVKEIIWKLSLIPKVTRGRVFVCLLCVSTSFHLLQWLVQWLRKQLRHTPTFSNALCAMWESAQALHLSARLIFSLSLGCSSACIIGRESLPFSFDLVNSFKPRLWFHGRLIWSTGLLLPKGKKNNHYVPCLLSFSSWFSTLPTGCTPGTVLFCISRIKQAQGVIQCMPHSISGWVHG